LSSRFATKILHAFLISHMCAACHVHIILSDLSTLIMCAYRVPILKLIIIKFSSFQYYFLPLGFGHNPQHLKRSQSVPLLQDKRQSSTPINNHHIDISIICQYQYIDIYEIGYNLSFIARGNLACCFAVQLSYGHKSCVTASYSLNICCDMTPESQKNGARRNRP
jgi:hypothetical protein